MFPPTFVREGHAKWPTRLQVDYEAKGSVATRLIHQHRIHLASIYSVNDIEIFTGGLAETQLKGAVVCPTTTLTESLPISQILFFLQIVYFYPI
jgi:hypothetical protein